MNTAPPPRNEAPGFAGTEERGVGVSSPVSSRRLLILVEQALEGSVFVRVVGDVVVPAVPDDVEPGAGEDAGGVGVVFAAGDGVVVELGCPGVSASGVGGEVADRVAQLLVNGPAETDDLVLAGLAGGGGDTGQSDQRVGVGEAGAAVADFGQQSGGAHGAGAGQA